MEFIQLQSIGKVKAKQAGELKTGDKMIWNFGEKSTVLSIEKETAKSIWIKEISDKSGNIYERRFLKTRLIATI